MRRQPLEHTQDQEHNIFSAGPAGMPLRRIDMAKCSKSRSTRRFVRSHQSQVHIPPPFATIPSIRIKPSPRGSNQAGPEIRNKGGRHRHRSPTPMRTIQSREGEGEPGQGPAPTRICLWIPPQARSYPKPARDWDPSQPHMCRHSLRMRLIHRSAFLQWSRAPSS